MSYLCYQPTFYRLVPSIDTSLANWDSSLYKSHNRIAEHTSENQPEHDNQRNQYSDNNPVSFFAVVIAIVVGAISKGWIDNCHAKINPACTGRVGVEHLTRFLEGGMEGQLGVTAIKRHVG